MNQKIIKNIEATEEALERLYLVYEQSTGHPFSEATKIIERKNSEIKVLENGSLEIIGFQIKRDQKFLSDFGLVNGTYLEVSLIATGGTKVLHIKIEDLNKPLMTLNKVLISVK